MPGSPVAPARPSGWRLTEPEPPRATPIAFAPGLRRIVAPNPGPMTYHGTNCWLIDHDGGTAVLDPGSAAPAHLRAIIDAAGETAGGVTLILLSHTHADHLDGTAELKALTGAPVAGYRYPASAAFRPDIALEDGDRIGALTALHTPGHAMDHLCFAHPDGVVLTGDHVMGWSTSVVPPPPHGDLDLYLVHLARIRDLGARSLLSAHGPPIAAPARLVQALIDHRLAREASILALIDVHRRDFDTLFAGAYPRIGRDLGRAATANLLGHLDRLHRAGHIRTDRQADRQVTALEGVHWWRDPPD